VSEAGFVLSLARRVERDLEERLGVTVLLTRDSDRDVSLRARTEAANMVPADLFISLHMDGHASPRVTGPRAVVSRPPLGRPGGVGSPLRDLGFQVWGDAQRGHLNRAYGLADRLVGELSNALGLPSRGVEEWPVPLLDAAVMPAVFLEIDSMTSDGVDGRLRNPDLEARISEAIVTAIDRYRREVP
jgi:N-acetylmuramoyl-L-alanine amidase